MSIQLGNKTTTSPFHRQLVGPQGQTVLWDINQIRKILEAYEYLYTFHNNELLVYYENGVMELKLEAYRE